MAMWCASRSYPTDNLLLKMRTLLTLRPPPPPSVLLPCLSSLSPPPSFLFSFRPSKRFHFLSPCSSLKQSKKKSLQKTTRPPNAPPPQSQRWFFNNPKGDEGGEIEKTDEADSAFGGDTALKGTVLAGIFLIGIVGGFAGVGYLYKDQINAFLNQFSTFIEGYGPAGYALFVAVYAGLEILAIPAVPLTMSAGLLFGTVTGSILVSISGTVAASVAFLIARYFARERILKMVEGNKKFLAIDKAIGENGFRIEESQHITIHIFSLILMIWLGMLPGTWAYVSAGAFGRAIIVSLQEESELGLTGGNGQLLTLGFGLLATALAAAYVTRLAKDAVKDID
ncbi:SNARE associated Golgi protein family [Prunus dulcis]|uniref:SNARE associated Golgi protein family n=1 Tax=Prunus dulcis TaxID=3755 RepID=A0A4Y1RWK2_PRUDU|nr:SNARE associated Golgi protein family [Prunus dulcis]